MTGRKGDGRRPLDNDIRPYAKVIAISCEGHRVKQLSVRDGEKRRRRSAQSGASRSQEESIAENITPVWVNVRVEVGRGLRKYVER